MKLITLASGSKGNSTLIISQKAKILIDDGLTFKAMKARLESIGIEPGEINGIFITHEHGDHTDGINNFVKKCPDTYVYFHDKNRKNIEAKCPNVPQKNLIGFERVVDLKDLHIEAFPLSHDSDDCVGYQVSEGDNKIAIATDLGYYDNNILEKLKVCSLCIVEANHDVNMLLKNPRYSTFTKARILSGKGHLSNQQSAEVIYVLAKNNVKQVILGHLSEENNTPELAYEHIKSYLKSKNIEEGKDIFIDIAPQRQNGTLFQIE